MSELYEATEVPDEPQTLPATTGDDEPTALIRHALASGATADQLQQLLEMRREVQRQHAEDEFHGALQRFQAACPPITKRRSATFKGQHAYNFASLDDVMAAIRPLLSECGLSIQFDTCVDNGSVTATCKVRHGLHVEASSVTLPVPDAMRVSETQKMGAAISYAKRYALCAALNIVVTDEDNDAEQLQGQPVTDDQLSTLRDLLGEFSEARAGKFREAFGIARLEDLPRARFDEAKRALTKKINDGDTQ